MRTFVTAAIACMSIVGLSHAGDAQAIIKKAVSIPAQDLATALQALAQDRQLYIIYAHQDVTAHQTRGASGELTRDEALQQLLNGTGLTYRYLDDNTVSILPIAAAPAVRTSALEDRQESPAEPRFHLAQAETAQLSSQTGEPEAQDGLEEVVVTATKRKENLQRVPQAITAVTAERLDELNAQTFEGYFRDVPGLNIISTGEGRRDYSLRGVSSGQINTNPSTVDISTVSQYFDDIPVTASGFQMDARLVDMDRVEVVRGPQGTLYGEGALGGTIRLITRKPVLRDFRGSIDSRVSMTQDGGTSNTENGMLNLPLGESAAVRLNGFYAYDAGYIDLVNMDPSGSQITGVYKRNANLSRSGGYRGQALLNATDSFSILGQAVHFKSTDDAVGGYRRDIGDLILPICPPPVLPNPGDIPGGGPAPLPVPGSNSCSDANFSDVTRWADLYNLTLNGDFGWATLVSASSYSNTDTEIFQRREYTTGPAPVGNGIAMLQNQKGYTQELRLVSSKSWSQRWDYIVGAYYQDTETFYDFPSNETGGSGAHSNTFKVKQKALFGDAGYMLTENLQARLGLRGSRVDNTGDTDVTVPTTQHLHSESDFTPLTGRAVLNYFLNRDMMLYTSVARGFRDGSINDTSINATFAGVSGFTPIPEHSDPDTNTTYELGWKLSFPARKATLNGALYHTDWDHMQVLSYAASDLTSGPGSIPAGLAPAYVNAPRARVDGLELEASIEIFRGLQARASWSFIDAVLTQDFPMFLLGGGTTLHALRGDRIPFVARSSGSVSLGYRHNLPNGFEGFALVNSQFQGPRATDFNKLLNTPIGMGGLSPVIIPTYFQMRSYWTSGMQVGVQNELWRVALTLDNLFNHRADLFNRDGIELSDRPRTVGIWLRRNFD